MRRLLVLGGGYRRDDDREQAAPELAPEEWEITVVDRDDDHHYQPGYLFMPFGTYTPDQVVKKRHAFIPDGVDLILAEIDRVDADGDTVALADGRVLAYDYLVIATGTTPRPDQTPGMLGSQWRRSVFDFYTFDGATALAAAMRSFDHGRLVIHITEMPIKCPVAPLEFTFLADACCASAGIRDRVELVYATPLSGAFTKPIASQQLGDMLEDRKILVEPDFLIERVDNDAEDVVSYDEREIPFDLLVTIPLNMGADFVARSGLGDELNYVPVDKDTFQSTAHANIFAIGDASNIPTSKAGSVAHFSVEMFVDNFFDHVARQADDGGVRRARELLHRVRPRQGAAHRLQLRDRAAARQVPAPGARPLEPAQGDQGQPPRQAGVQVDLLEPAAARPAASAAIPHVHGRQGPTTVSRQTPRRQGVMS